MAKKATKTTKAIKATTASAATAGSVTLTGFPPLVGKNPTTLILGEFPGECSLYTGLYYSHWSNSLRDIIADIFNNGIPFRKYIDFENCLKSNHIALWDVYETRTMNGDIVIGNTPNDIATFLKNHPTIRKIIFNGRAAEAEFNKMGIPFTGCAVYAPSTSGRNNKKGSKSYLTKLAAWKQVLP